MLGTSTDSLLDLLKSYYPGGTTVVLSKPDGTVIVTVYKVSAAQLDARRMMSARYGMPDGALYERPEPRLGTVDTSGGQDVVLPPEGLIYPTVAEWVGGLVSPAYGVYRMEVDAPAGGMLEIDGQQVLTTTAGVPPSEASVIMSKGVHILRLRGVMDSASAQIVLRWGTENSQLVPVGREFFWSGPQGALAGQVYSGVEAPNIAMQAQSPALPSAPVVLRNDGVFSWGNLSYSLRAGPSPFVVWRGTLVAPSDGPYYFEALTPGAVTIWIDGQLVGVSNVPGSENKWPVNMQLAAGEHAFEMQFYGNQDNSPFQLMWQPPGKTRSVLTPDALLPAEGGVSVSSQAAPAQSPDSSVIHSVVPKPVEVEATLGANGWNQALGIAVLGDGRYAVGDSGAHRLIIYGADGKQQAAWGGASSGEDTFNDVSDLVTGLDGAIVALDAENADIRIFDAQGHQLSRIRRDKMGLTHARGITVGPDGKFYIADTAGSRVVRVDGSGNIEIVYQQGNGTISALNQPMDVAVTPDGSVYVVDLLGRVVKFDPPGRRKKSGRCPSGEREAVASLLYGTA